PGVNRIVTSAVAFAARPIYRLTLSTVGSGTILNSPSGSLFLSGTTVTLTAVPASGWQFAGWSGNLAGSVNPIAITMDANKSVVANFTPIPPVITTQPVSQTVIAGSDVSFSIVASGTPPLTYQWKKNGVNIAGATTTTLSLANVQVEDSGAYTAVV